MINRYLLFSLLVIFTAFSGTIISQTKTNLEILYSLADSTVASLKGKNVCLRINNSGQFAVFNNTVSKTAQLIGIKNCSDDNGNFVSLTFDKGVVLYPEMFRSGFLSAHLLKREVKLSGNYYSAKEGYQEFSFTSLDTVRLDEVKNIEDASFPFTRGEVPSEPFFSGIYEPLAAIGTAAAIIVLYFTVRSK